MREGPRPEAFKNFTVEQAFDQIAAWLGMTAADVKRQFNLVGCVDYVSDETTRITFGGDYSEIGETIKTRCIVLTTTGFLITKILICFDFATQRLVIADIL